MLLEKTISIFTDKGRGFNSTNKPYVEINDIEYDGDKPVLMAGRPLTVNEAKNLFALTSDSVEHKGYILPADVLMWHTDSTRAGNECIFWVKSHVAPLHHSQLDKSLNVPWPSLIFKISYGRMNMFALKNKRNRPTENSKLYHVPAWNTSSDGSVCTGNCTIKKQQSPKEAVKFWKKLWFGSDFTHEGNGTYHDMDLLDFWKKLDGKTEFPTTMLRDSSYRLGDI